MFRRCSGTSKRSMNCDVLAQNTVGKPSMFRDDVPNRIAWNIDGTTRARVVIVAAIAQTAAALCEAVCALFAPLSVDTLQGMLVRRRNRLQSACNRHRCQPARERFAHVERPNGQGGLSNLDARKTLRVCRRFWGQVNRT